MTLIDSEDIHELIRQLRHRADTTTEWPLELKQGMKTTLMLVEGVVKKLEEEKSGGASMT